MCWIKVVRGDEPNFPNPIPKKLLLASCDEPWLRMELMDGIVKVRHNLEKSMELMEGVMKEERLKIFSAVGVNERKCQCECASCGQLVVMKKDDDFICEDCMEYCMHNAK